MRRSCISIISLAVATTLLLAPVASAQENSGSKTPAETATAELLPQLNGSLVALTARVSRAVVQIQVTGFGPSDKKSNDDGEGLTVVAEEHAIGSGVILDPQGY